jgi:hypothetical protein
MRLARHGGTEKYIKNVGQKMSKEVTVGWEDLELKKG